MIRSSRPRAAWEHIGSPRDMGRLGKTGRSANPVEGRTPETMHPSP